MKRLGMMIVIVSLVLACPFSAFAAKYALLIGINAYPGSQRLQGCVNDVAMMRDVLEQQFGFAPQDIVSVVDRQATRAGIESAFQSHLVSRVRSGDVVVVYFSGHGTRVPDANGDEVDGFDEVLCPVNISQNAETWLTDDELDQWIAQLPTDRVTVILDTGFSGDSTKSAVSVKAMDLGMTGPKQIRVAERDFMDPAVNYTLITGYAPDQTAYMRPDDKGSIFTSALTRVLMDIAGNAAYDFVVEPLMQRVSDEMSAQLQTRGFVPAPRVEGAANAPLFGGIEARQTERVTDLRPASQQVITRPRELRVNIRTNKLVYYDGEYIQVFVEADQDCYLKLYNVRADNQIYLVFPNEWNQNNFVRAGTSIIPGQRDNFEFLVTAPFGTERLIAAVSPHQFDDVQAINWYGKGFPKLAVTPRMTTQLEISYEVRPR